MRADWFALVWDQRNWQLGFILVNLITGRDGPTSACCSAKHGRVDANNL